MTTQINHWRTFLPGKRVETMACGMPGAYGVSVDDKARVTCAECAAWINGDAPTTPTETVSETIAERLAKAADELADECEKGTAPEFGRSCLFANGKPCCAVGHVFGRAGVADNGWVLAGSVLRHVCNVADPSALSAASLVEDANDAAPAERRTKAVVAPLRRLAIELRKS